MAAITLWPGAGLAQDVRIADRMQVAWQDWLNDAGVAEGALAIIYEGEVVRSVGQGVDAGAPMEMASLSKAVTAVCVLALVDEGLLSYETNLYAALRPAYPGMPETLRGLTVGQLLTHTSGIGPDSTQETMGRWLRVAVARHHAVAKAVLARPEQTGRAGVYAYNNENYAMLGEIIARVTGQPYRSACADRVLPPEDYPTATVSPVAGAFDAWGGWQMSVDDYARFVTRHFGSGAPVAAMPGEFPHSDAGGGAYYGPGMIWRDFRGSHNFWHFGALCFDDAAAGSYAVIWMGRWGAVAAWSDCLEFDRMIALDGALSAAVFAP